MGVLRVFRAVGDRGPVVAGAPPCLTAAHPQKMICRVPQDSRGGGHLSLGGSSVDSGPLGTGVLMYRGASHLTCYSALDECDNFTLKSLQ